MEQSDILQEVRDEVIACRKSYERMQKCKNIIMTVSLLFLLVFLYSKFIP